MMLAACFRWRCTSALDICLGACDPAAEPCAAAATTRTGGPAASGEGQRQRRELRRDADGVEYTRISTLFPTLLHRVRLHQGALLSFSEWVPLSYFLLHAQCKRLGPWRWQVVCIETRTRSLQQFAVAVVEQARWSGQERIRLGTCPPAAAATAAGPPAAAVQP